MLIFAQKHVFLFQSRNRPLSPLRPGSLRISLPSMGSGKGLALPLPMETVEPPNPKWSSAPALEVARPAFPGEAVQHVLPHARRLHPISPHAGRTHHFQFKFTTAPHFSPPHYSITL